MKHSIITIMVTILLSEHVMAWDFTSPVGGRCSGMGYTSVAMSDFWSIHNNPAGMAEWRHISAGFYYENRFLMKELGYKNAAFLIPLDIGVIGLSVRQFGFTHYNENKIGIAFARSFGKSLRIGIQLDYLLFAFSKDYKNTIPPLSKQDCHTTLPKTLCGGLPVQSCLDKNQIPQQRQTPDNNESRIAI